MVIPDKQRLYTADEFEAISDQPENRERRFELIFGEIVEKMPTQIHAAIAHLISGFLFMFLRQNPIGWALIEARYQLPGDEHNARLPDLSFVSNRTHTLVKKGAAPYMPDFAVEIKSPDDKLNEMRDKAAYYLANGTKLVWLVYPEKRLVIVLTPGGEDIFTDKDTLDGGEVLPGFTLAVGEIFVD